MLYKILIFFKGVYSLLMANALIPNSVTDSPMSTTLLQQNGDVSILARPATTQSALSVKVATRFQPQSAYPILRADPTVRSVLQALIKYSLDKKKGV